MVVVVVAVLVLIVMAAVMEGGAEVGDHFQAQLVLAEGAKRAKANVEKVAAKEAVTVAAALAVLQQVRAGIERAPIREGK